MGAEDVLAKLAETDPDRMVRKHATKLLGGLPLPPSRVQAGPDGGTSPP